MPVFNHNGIKFTYKVEGEGTPLLLLHGLGDNLNLILDMYQRVGGIKLVVLDQRGHGNSEHDFKEMSFDKLADDAISLMNYLGITNFYIGGLSMGAGVALNVALHQVRRVLGLILIRSSSTDKPMKKEVQDWFSTVSKYLPVKRGQQLFEADPVYYDIEKIYPRALNTFNRYFIDPASIKYFQKFEEMSKDAPLKNKKDLDVLKVPVLVLSNKYDFIHPIEYSLFYKDNIKNVTYFELTPKIINSKKHKQELNMAINEFITAPPLNKQS